MNWWAASLPSFFNCFREVAIVLLIRAVELEDGGGILAEMRGAVVDLVGHIRLQVLARQLDRFDLARLGTVTLFGRLHLGSSPLSPRMWVCSWSYDQWNSPLTLKS